MVGNNQKTNQPLLGSIQVLRSPKIFQVLQFWEHL